MDLTQVTLTQMRYAVAVADTLNFRQAAEQCHVSQSGLSMQIHKLEELLGCVLFDRSRKPVLATAEGSSAVEQMRAVLRETERLAQVIAEGDEPAGRFRLGVIPSLSPTVLPLFLPHFVRNHARVELIVEELQTHEIISRLRAEQLDAGLAATPLDIRGLHERPLGREPMFAYLPAGDPLLRRKTVDQTSLRDRALWVMPEGHCFRTQVLTYCDSQTRLQSGPIQFESGSFQTLVRLVNAGLGATVLPELVVQGLSAHHRKKQVRPLVNPTPVREIGLVTTRAHLRRRVSDALADSIERGLAGALSVVSPRATILRPVE